MTRSGVRGVIFDVGEILARDVMEHIAAAVAAEHACDPEQTLREFRTVWARFSRKSDGTPVEEEAEFWELLALGLGTRFDARLDVEAWKWNTTRFIVPIPGMLPILERLHAARVTLGICSNNISFWADRQRRATGFDRFIPEQHRVWSFRVGHEKSSPGLEMFHAVVEATKVEAPQLLFVDDRLDNVERARQLGMETLLLPSTVPEEERAALLERTLKDIGLLA